MACTDCGGGCSCVIVPGRGGSVSGSGIPRDPYVIGTAGPVSPDWQTNDTRTWDTATVSLADLAEPTTLEVTLQADVTDITLPSWLETVSGIITLVITNTGSYDVIFPGLTAGGVAIGVTDNGLTLVHLLWTGKRWIALLGAGALA